MLLVSDSPEDLRIPDLAESIEITAINESIPPLEQVTSEIETSLTTIIGQDEPVEEISYSPEDVASESNMTHVQLDNTVSVSAANVVLLADESSFRFHIILLLVYVLTCNTLQ